MRNDSEGNASGIALLREETFMIPKIIHYCWFGGNPLPESAIKCINSWKKFFPDYEIKEWNESNYDVTKIPYIKEAYEAKKYAFVSDYARFDILYQYGGVYFDTDVEVIKSFDDIIAKGGFMGQEAGATSGVNPTSNKSGSLEPGAVANPGLGIAVAPGLRLYREILDSYSTRHFIKGNGAYDTTTICVYTTEVLKKYGYDETKEDIQEVAGITVYPPEYFCPYNVTSSKMNITENTRSIHWFSATWHTKLDDIVIRLEQCNKGNDSIEYKIRRTVSLPFRVINKAKIMGVRNTVAFAMRKLRGLSDR